jgi:hypothetical protein
MNSDNEAIQLIESFLKTEASPKLKSALARALSALKRKRTKVAQQ